MSLAENLYKYRIKAGYTSARGFAKKLGINCNTYYSYEYKGSTPSAEILCRIADKLNVTTDELLGRKKKHLVQTEKIMEILNKTRDEVDKQVNQWGDEKELLPHQWLGLIQEEIGEVAEAVNETYLPNLTKKHLGGKEHIEEETYQTIALLCRFLIYINEKGK